MKRNGGGGVQWPRPSHKQRDHGGDKSTGKSGSQTNTAGWLTQSKWQTSMAMCTLCNKEPHYESSGFSSILLVVVTLWKVGVTA